MNVLVIGGGGREHALAWKLAQSAARCKMVLCGARQRWHRRATQRLKNVPDHRCECSCASGRRTTRSRLTVVGPEAPLAAGVVDEFRAHGMRIFGPTKAAAQLESSKAFSKAFMRRHGIPTADIRHLLRPGGSPRLRGQDGRAHGGQGRRLWLPARAWWWP